MQNLEESVIEFVAAFTGFKAERIHLQTTLYGDLGVAGDDGWCLAIRLVRSGLQKRSQI